MYTMKVFLGTDGLWYVRDDDPRIREEFGTDTLPTPWRKSVPPEKVLGELRVLNPDRYIIL